MSTHREPVHLAGAVMGGTRHACAFFRSPDEEYKVMLPFIREGLDGSDKVLQIVDPERRPELLLQLAGIGVDTGTLQQTGQLEVRTWEEAHLQGHRFDQGTWLGIFEDTVAGHRLDGYPQT